MAIRYYKLFDLMNRKGIKKMELLELAHISPPTLSKLSKNESITTDTINKLCTAFECQPGDIMEWEKDEQE